MTEATSMPPTSISQGLATAAAVKKSLSFRSDTLLQFSGWLQGRGNQAKISQIRVLLNCWRWRWHKMSFFPTIHSRLPQRSHLLWKNKSEKFKMNSFIAQHIMAPGNTMHSALNYWAADGTINHLPLHHFTLYCYHTR